MRHRSDNGPRRRRRIFTTVAAILAVAAIALGIGIYNHSSDPTEPLPVDLPPATASYLGVFASGLPASYAPVTAFTNATGAHPDVVMYYSGWFVPFPAGFAATAANHGAVPLVQMDPDKTSADISIAGIASGRYDGYLSSYAEAVRVYRHPVILSFGHEMNGSWSPWGYKHTSPAVFVAAWRHIVTLFRRLGAQNVTWLWTVNSIHQPTGVPAPNPWWPGSSFVTWVGIDGYYTTSSSVFASVFGPTVADVRTLTRKPILIAETAAAPAAIQPAKISDLFAGIHLYGLLGFVWFDADHTTDWRLRGAAAFAAFRRAVRTYQTSAP